MLYCTGSRTTKDTKDQENRIGKTTSNSNGVSHVSHKPGAAAVIASQDCYGPAEQFCAFAGARDIVNVNVYLMYYLDFLIIQFSSKTAQHMAAPLRKKTGTSPRPSGANVKSPTTDVSIAKSPMDDQ